MDKFIQHKESNTPFILDHSRELNEIAGFQIQNRRCQMPRKFGPVLRTLDRSILLMIAGLFLSASAFSQPPGGPATPYTASELTMQSSSNQKKTPVNLPLELIMYRVAAAQVLLPSHIQEPRRAYFLGSKFSVTPEPIFRVEDRKIPGTGESNPIQLYTPNAQTGLPGWRFFHGGGLVASILVYRPTRYA